MVETVAEEAEMVVEVTNQTKSIAHIVKPVPTTHQTVEYSRELLLERTVQMQQKHQTITRLIYFSKWMTLLI